MASSTWADRVEFLLKDPEVTEGLLSIRALSGRAAVLRERVERSAVAAQLAARALIVQLGQCATRTRRGMRSPQFGHRTSRSGNRERAQRCASQ